MVSEISEKEALSLARGVLAQIMSAGHNMPGPTAEDIEKAFWATDSALARAEANAGEPVAGSTARPAPQPSGPVEVTPETVHPSHDVRDEDISGIISDPVCQRCRISAYGPQKDRLLKPCRADEHGINPDDEAVDRFALAMKAKLKWEREERGRYGWNDPSVCSEEYLSRLLIEHLAKGNEGNFEDIANFCMMLHQRGAHPQVLASALTAGKPEQVPSGWQEAYVKGMYEAARLVDLDAAQLEAGKLTVNATGMRMLAGYIRQRADAAPSAPTAGGGDAE